VKVAFSIPNSQNPFYGAISPDCVVGTDQGMEVLLTNPWIPDVKACYMSTKMPLLITLGNGGMLKNWSNHMYNIHAESETRRPLVGAESPGF
jgi:hypothetical protein